MFIGEIVQKINNDFAFSIQKNWTDVAMMIKNDAAVRSQLIQFYEVNGFTANDYHIMRKLKKDRNNNAHNFGLNDELDAGHLKLIEKAQIDPKLKQKILNYFKFRI